MRKSDPFRLAALALVIIFIQLASYIAFPSLIAAFDLYPVFILLATASAGAPLGYGLAILGGVLMDLFGTNLLAFHSFYYLIPATIGVQLRAHMLTEFRTLGSLTAISLIIGKIIAMLLFFLVTGKIDSPLYLLRLNYWPLVAIALVFYFSWPWFVRQFPMPVEAKHRG
jgi:hypothetical protein